MTFSAAIASGAVLFASFAITATWAIQSTLRQAHFEICQLVESNFYNDSIEKREWVTDCRRRAARLPITLSKSAFVADTNAFLDLLETSHLSLYDPTENRRTWQRQALETGLRVRMIEDGFFVFKLLPAGPAEKAGIKLGDRIDFVNRHRVSGPWMPQTQPGEFIVSREGKRLTLQIAAEDLAEDVKPAYKKLDETSALLMIPSFLSQNFEKSEWQKIAERINGTRHLILDLRGNAGGNFAAMMRVLSTLDCRAGVVGALIRPGGSGTPQVLSDDLSSATQLKQVMSSPRLELEVFPDYPCFQGQLTVLIDRESSSVTEVLADALMHRPQTRVWGAPTPGNVVMARWFPVQTLGEDFNLSIPIAAYVNSANEALEAMGVRPGQYLDYRQEEASRGLDSWLLRALEKRF